ncbi:P-loop containing nucleoside triphosphate hydrolase protein [Lipomyces kononenkoae]
MANRSPNPVCKVIIVGDGACGKTSMFLTYTRGEFPELYVPTVFENYSHNVQLRNGKSLALDLWDTAGQEDYDRLRPIAYTDVAVVLLAFSVDMPDSLENVYDKWWPEAMHYCPVRTPMILAEGMANKIAVPYVECSSKTGEGLRIVFQTAVDAITKSSTARKRGKCIIS